MSSDSTHRPTIHQRTMTPALQRSNTHSADSDTSASIESPSPPEKRTQTIAATRPSARFTLTRAARRLLRPGSRSTRQSPFGAWDAIVLAAFCICLVVFFRALAGVGCEENLGDGHALRSAKNTHAHFSVDSEGYYSSSLQLHADALDTALDPEPTYNTGSSQQSAQYSQPPREALFPEEEVYADNDGQPFALKVHLDAQMPDLTPISSRRRARCRAGECN